MVFGKLFEAPDSVGFQRRVRAQEEGGLHLFSVGWLSAKDTNSSQLVN